MKMLVAGVLACCLVAPSTALADEAQTIGRAGGMVRAGAFTTGALQRAIAPEVSPMTRSTFSNLRSAAFAQEQQSQPKPAARQRSGIGRHPVIVGALLGFVGGFLFGYLAGDDGVFYDFTAGFNGLVVGGIGAGTGALVGVAVGAARK